MATSPDSTSVYPGRPLLDLVRAMRLQSLPRLALVGAGGKTTALFQLARQFTTGDTVIVEGVGAVAEPRPVLVTASTHLARHQLALADNHMIMSRMEDLSSIEAQILPGINLVTGSQLSEERVRGLDPALLVGLLEIADRKSMPYLIEADGSRQHPVKAPADHEPPIPPFVDTVVVVLGASAIGKPLSGEWVHRPERFAVLAGIQPGEVITLDCVSRVLLDPVGGLKNIPVSARRLVLINQVDTPDRVLLAKELVGSLLPAYQAVVITSLRPSQKRKPLVYAVYEPVTGIILAAGTASRFGEPKQLLDWEGIPLVRKAAKTAINAGLAPVIVVLGAYQQKVRMALKGLPVIPVYNPDWENGMSTSLKTGLDAITPDVAAVIFLLADQPMVTVPLIRALVDTHAATLSPLVAPQVEGKRANPCLFDRVTFHDLLNLHGDVGGRSLFSQPERFPVAWVPWEDRGLLIDIDTPDEYQHLLRTLDE